MNLLCISASNIEPFRAQSASTRACRLAAELAAGMRPGLQTEVLALIDYELTPCRMCAACLDSGRCCRDEAFNQVHARMQAVDALLLVVPHYAPFPSKVMMLLEKLQEMAFLNYCRDESYRSPLAGKPVAVVGHGGQTEQAVPYFLKNHCRTASERAGGHRACARRRGRRTRRTERPLAFARCACPRRAFSARSSTIGTG